MLRLSTIAIVLSFASVAVFGQTVLGTATLGPPPNLSGPDRIIINPATNKTYLFAGNMVDVIDLGSQHVGTIALPPEPTSASPGAGPLGVWVNTTKNRIYAFRGNQFVTIDGSNDTVLQTFSLPPLLDTTYGPIAYNAASSRLYVGEINSTTNGGEVRIVDDTSFATLSIVPVNVIGGVSHSEKPEQILINPTNNRVYIIYQTSGAQVLDGSTNAVLASAFCDQTCSGLSFPPGINGAMINPADNSVWVAWSGIPPIVPGGEDGANGSSGAPFTIFWRIDGVTNAFTTQFQIFGRETELLGFDASSGLMYMMATDLPTVPNPTTTDLMISAIETMLVVLDPKQTTATAADPSPMRRITVDGTQLAGTGTSYTCGNGVQSFEPIGLDLSGGYIFWRCDGTTKSFSSIVVSRLKFTDLGNVDYSQFVGQLATTGAGQISAHAIPVGISKDFDFANNLGTGGTSIFFSQYDNLFFNVNPAIPGITTVSLGARPAGIAVDPATRRAFVTDLTSRVLSIVDLTNYALLNRTPGPGGPFIAANGAGQFALGGPSDPAADPAQVNGAFLFNEASGGIQIPLQGAVTSALDVNAATNVAFLADGNQWIATDLSTGSRLYAVTSLSTSASDTCQMSGISVSKSTNQVFVAGKCAAGGNTIAVFEG
ncbi:MAG TPA: hypothetical protein VGH38_18460, partial [Bryobacteraceae bacterium]